MADFSIPEKHAMALGSRARVVDQSVMAEGGLAVGLNHAIKQSA